MCMAVWLYVTVISCSSVCMYVMVCNVFEQVYMYIAPLQDIYLEAFAMLSYDVGC